MTLSLLFLSCSGAPEDGYNATVLKVSLHEGRMWQSEDAEADRASCAIVRDDTGAYGIHTFLSVDPTPKVNDRVCAAVGLLAGERHELSCSGERHLDVRLVADPTRCNGQRAFLVDPLR